MALVKCTECGKEISNEAPSCPNCGKPTSAAADTGKRKGTGCLPMIGLIVVGTVIATIVGVNLNSDDKSQSPETAQVASAARPVYKTTARALYRDYEANEVATDQKIGNSVVEVTGIIASIDKDFKDSAVIYLVTDNQFSSAGLTLVDSEKNRAASLSKGEEIVVRCEKMTRIIGSPLGTSCRIASEPQKRK
jgi:hypothetical protein